jgi:hypothetical protein
MNLRPICQYGDPSVAGKGAEGEYSRTLDEAVASWQRELAKHPEDAPEEPADPNAGRC